MQNNENKGDDDNNLRAFSRPKGNLHSASSGPYFLDNKRHKFKYLGKNGSGGGCKTDNDGVDLETVDLDGSSGDSGFDQ